MIRNLLALYYLPRYSRIIVYMLQNTEYRVGPYLRWYWRTQDFSRVMYRRQLNPTRAARLLQLALLLGMSLQIMGGLALIALWYWRDMTGGGLFGLAALVAYPVVWAHLIAIAIFFGHALVWPRRRARLRRAKAIFAKHPGIKIAVAGSYGKTSMKELLLSVLAEGKKVAATPANKNVALSHADFASRLKGDEDILIIEYGEGKPGDVARFARLTQPTHGIITGLAPAHLDRYKTLAAAGRDIFSLADFLQGQNVYVNGDSEPLRPFIKDTYQQYDSTGALGWRTSHITLQPDATSFTLTKGKRRVQLTSGLLGQHQVGPLSLVAALAFEFGLSEGEVQAGMARTRPFEHRMQPYQLAGAWIIDDTYNGNLEGVRAGTALLAALPASRKLYVTPGLVDQGRETIKVHTEMGQLIAQAHPDIVVLMQNSVTGYIRRGLEQASYTGELRIEADPLQFYTNLDQFVVTGDVVLMQNDWTDNYA
jgi:UDP-N-acetylmuramyl pentapeptide synthase